MDKQVSRKGRAKKCADQQVQQEPIEIPLISIANTVVDPRTVVVHLLDAMSTKAAVMDSLKLRAVAKMAHLATIGFTIFVIAADQEPGRYSPGAAAQRSEIVQPHARCDPDGDPKPPVVYPRPGSVNGGEHHMCVGKDDGGYEYAGDTYHAEPNHLGKQTYEAQKQPH